MPDVVTAEVGGEIVIKTKELPGTALALIKSALSVPNEDKQKKMAERVYGSWDLPDVIPLWREEARRGGDHVICLPRGFAYYLLPIITQSGATLQWDDRRTLAPAAPGYFRQFELRDYQLSAVIKMIDQEQGFYESPAGSGKTVTMLGLCGFIQQRTVIIVDKAGLLEQWRSRAAKFHGLSLDLGDERSVGKIGEDVWEERDLTIALRQTLWARMWQIDALSWFSKYGLTVFDEGHHLAADTTGEIARRVSSRYMLGTSATPAKSEAKGQIIHALVGPIIAQTTRQELYERGVLVKPVVEQISSDFEADFWPTHDAEFDFDADTFKCQVPGCKKTVRHMHRNNYASVLKRLVEDKTRNEMIARRIVSERGHVHLVPSKQLKHLDLLRKAVVEAGWDGPIYMLRGEENAAGMSQYIAEAVAAGGQWEMVMVEGPGDNSEPYEDWRQVDPIGKHGREAVIFSTVADEGLDIPPIDRVHVVFPMRLEAAVIQLIGRGERQADGKTDSVIVDINDMGCQAFADQAMAREAVFRKIGFNVSQRVNAF